MKRLFFVASLAILAAACQKTEIQNEVQTPISFSTETGKQTRAITQDSENKTYPTDQPFGVYAYSYQVTTDETTGESTRKHGTNHTPMDNVEVSVRSGDSKWAATGDVKYYWPNDPSTRLDFYAYSPATGSANATNGKNKPHQQINGLFHSEADGLKLTNYTHSNMYVDFMVATPVIGATYSDQNGNANETITGDVPLVFGHKMTQVNFTVKLNAPLKANSTTEYVNTYPNIDFTINSIVLNNIVSKSTYSYNNEADTESSTLAWNPGESSVISDYKVYPATKVAYTDQTDYPHSYGAPAIDNIDDSSADVEAEVVLRTDANIRTTTEGETVKTLAISRANPGVSFNTTPVTMIPQTWLSGTNEQSVTITYTISGVGVATEQVVKTFPITAPSYPTWDINKKITYTLTIGLNEITFAPSVTNWGNNVNVYEYSPENIN